MPTKVCSVCKTEKDISCYSKANGGKNLKYGVSYRCKDCDSKNSERWRQKNYKKVQRMSRERHLQVNYGISTEEYEQMVADRKGLCDCCNEKVIAKPPLDKLVVDHCHNTGKIRGLLCNKCNVGIGILGDTVEHINRAISYLERIK